MPRKNTTFSSVSKIISIPHKITNLDFKLTPLPPRMLQQSPKKKNSLPTIH